MATAFVPNHLGDISPDEAMLVAIRWLRQQGKPHCVLAAGVRIIEYSEPLRRLVRRDEITTLRSASRSMLSRAAAVLGCWPSADDLAELHRVATAGTAVCVVRWVDTVEERVWINSTGAMNLLTGQVGDDRYPVAVDPVVQVAMRSLSASVNLSGWHPMDENRIKWVLLNAPREGHPYDPDHLFEWVLTEQLFPWYQAAKLRKLAAQVCEGRSLRIRYGTHYVDDIFDKWRREADGI
ncbi:hypothetical protein [Candidatus Poriferisodalis sp.]|uniref:hypothetical protein n=1 Tax=Candidatus Poriferisodalis sp. TaxID=3101277 RepID=UPI003AF4E9D5